MRRQILPFIVIHAGLVVVFAMRGAATALAGVAFVYAAVTMLLLARHGRWARRWRARSQLPLPAWRPAILLFTSWTALAGAASRDPSVLEGARGALLAWAPLLASAAWSWFELRRAAREITESRRGGDDGERRAV